MRPAGTAVINQAGEETAFSPLPWPDPPIVPRPAVAIVAQAAGDRLPSYVTREQARAISNAAATTSIATGCQQ